MSSKTHFPELVGKTGEEAKAAILAEFPDFTVVVLDVGTPTTREYLDDRVRVFVDKEGKVAEEPHVA